MQQTDFEPDDNTGRTSEPDAAARGGPATTEDLVSWARRAAAEFLAAHPLPADPPPVPDTAPYRTALSAAETQAEVSAVMRHFLRTVQPTLHATFDFLMTVAERGDQHLRAGPDSPTEQLIYAANCSVAVLGVADQADREALRAEYDPPPSSRAAPKPASTTLPAPPEAPGPPPVR
ncbi:hypothetical protein [Streptomyces californicus]|uniref:hypothetical protein n=1 Tax=Streptomyces californicus TaxID=67351 RepID=UPI0033180B6C